MIGNQRLQHCRDGSYFFLREQFAIKGKPVILHGKIQDIAVFIGNKTRFFQFFRRQEIGDCPTRQPFAVNAQVQKTSFQVAENGEWIVFDFI